MRSTQDYCPFGIGGLYCGEYKSCPSGHWGAAGELCVPEGSGIVLDPDRPGSDWGTIAEVKDDCPNPSWETMTCPQNMPEDQGDCLDPSFRYWQFPLRPLPSSSEAGPKRYPGQGHGMGIDGVPIVRSARASPRPPAYRQCICLCPRWSFVRCDFKTIR